MVTTGERNCFDHIMVVLSGGWGRLQKEIEHTHSYADAVNTILSCAGYKVKIIECGEKRELFDAVSSMENVIVFNTLFGCFGEDGTIPALFEYFGLSYTGSGPFPSVLAMDKARCSLFVHQCGIPVPEFLLLSYSKWIASGMPILSSLSKHFAGNIAFSSRDVLCEGAVLVKPNKSAFSSGVSTIYCASDLPEAMQIASDFDDEIMLQRHIDGITVHVPVLCGKALAPVEVIPNLSVDPIGCTSIRSSTKTYLVKQQLSSKTVEQLQQLSETVYATLGCRGLTRCDFRVTSDNQVFFLETNTQHSIRPNSIASLSGKESGLTLLDMVESVLYDRWVPQMRQGWQPK